MKRAGVRIHHGGAATAHVSRWPTSSAVAPLTNTSAGCATPTVGAAAYWSAGSRHSSRLRESVVCRPACTPLLLPDGAEYELLQRAGEAGVGGALVATALLVWFYLALAVMARVWAGTEPVDVAGAPPQSGVATVDTVIWLALAVVGFEICTTANNRLRSAGRPMAIAVAAVAGCAAVIWFADHLGATGGFRLAPTEFGFIVSEFFGESGGIWILISSLLGNAAALIVLIFAAARIGCRQLETATLLRPSRWTTTTAVAVPAAVLGAAASDWVGGIIADVWPMLLLTLYLLVAYASSQIPGCPELIWWIRALTAALLAAVLVLPLLDYGTLRATWPAVIAAALVGLAFAVGSWLTPVPDQT